MQVSPSVESMCTLRERCHRYRRQFLPRLRRPDVLNWRQAVSHCPRAQRIPPGDFTDIIPMSARRKCHAPSGGRRRETRSLIKDTGDDLPEGQFTLTGRTQGRMDSQLPGQIVERPDRSDGGSLLQGDIFAQRYQCGEIIHLFCQQPQPG